MTPNIRHRSRGRQTTRFPNARHHLSSAPRAVDRTTAASPAEPLPTGTWAGRKRKERDFESDPSGDETNIHVVVRCRGRNEREVKENSALVVDTEGARGTQIDLRLGTNILSNKCYSFDRVFSHAADQSMVYDDTVKPILDEMLAGYNCTIFAYGQTGTGKTYTMSGDMTDTLGMLSDQAGIIPRLLQQLFTKLATEEMENCVKCSFIELYNEELRDLLSTDETVKLKIYDDASRRGPAATIVQGMEEKHIKTAAEGIRVLQDGNFKRQVAATNYNDYSSRSHTIFTITSYVKKANENGVEDLVSAGKLHLVDLAGSENIQRSGADNKRATEAGMINKSLLTLGRVINALVDRSSHIPYRESKLTRLLQDSLGGRTKTCIIATISPAKSSLEETMSTLDYAFRAKNIRNRPQLHAIYKNALLKDLTSEIEKLKSELISTRQRNGIYLSNEMYEGIVAESESRRMVMEEQSARIETLKTNIQNKSKELFSLTSSFERLKKDLEKTKAQLDETKNVLNQTGATLSTTQKTLAEEICLRKAHAGTEEKLAVIGDELISKLQQTVNDISGLHAKNKRRSDLLAINRETWSMSQNQVADVTCLLEQRVRGLQDEHRKHISGISQRTETFISEELKRLSSTQGVSEENLGQFAESAKQLLAEKQKSKLGMDEVLEDIKKTCDTIKNRVGDSLQLVSRAAEKLGTEVSNEMTNFHHQLDNSYNSFGKDLTSLFEDLVCHMTTQRCEADHLRRQLQSATNTIVSQNANISTYVQHVLEKERQQAAEDRQKLSAQISALVNQHVNQHAEAQEARLLDRAVQIQTSLVKSNTSLTETMSCYGQGMDVWDERGCQVLEEAEKSRDQLKTKLDGDWATASQRSTSILNAARSIYSQTQRVVNEQTDDFDSKMEALDGFVTSAKFETVAQHEAYAQAIRILSDQMEQSFSNVLDQLKTTSDRVKSLGEEVGLDANEFYIDVEALETRLCQPLASLREDISNAKLQEYQPTGATPQKGPYHYPTLLPRTEVHDIFISGTDETPQATTEGISEGDDSNMACPEPDKTVKASSSPHQSNVSVSEKSGLGLILRQVDPNITMARTTGAVSFDSGANTSELAEQKTWLARSTSRRKVRG